MIGLDQNCGVKSISLKATKKVVGVVVYWEEKYRSRSYMKARYMH